MSEQPEVDPTVEPSGGPARPASTDQTFEKSSDFLAGGRYPLSDEDIHSRANVRHLMARSDALDGMQAKFERLQADFFEKNTQLSVMKARAERNSVYDSFMTFCNSFGFAVSGYAASLLTATGVDKTLPVIWTISGLIIAGGSVLAQFRLRMKP